MIRMTKMISAVRIQNYILIPLETYKGLRQGDALLQYSPRVFVDTIFDTKETIFNKSRYADGVDISVK